MPTLQDVEGWKRPYGRRPRRRQGRHAGGVLPRPPERRARHGPPSGPGCSGRTRASLPSTALPSRATTCGSATRRSAVKDAPRAEVERRADQGRGASPLRPLRRREGRRAAGADSRDVASRERHAGPRDGLRPVPSDGSAPSRRSRRRPSRPRRSGPSPRPDEPEPERRAGRPRIPPRPSQSREPVPAAHRLRQRAEPARARGGADRPPSLRPRAPTPVLAERPREQALERCSEGWLDRRHRSCSRAVRAAHATSITEELVRAGRQRVRGRIVAQGAVPGRPPQGRARRSTGASSSAAHSPVLPPRALAQPVRAANAAGDLVGLVRAAARSATSARGGSPAKPGAATRSSSGRRRFATTVGAAGAGPSRSRSKRRDLDLDAVGRGVLARRRDATRRSWSTPSDRRPAELAPRRSPARPSRSRGRASGAAGLELEQQLEAQPRRVVRAGAERLRRDRSTMSSDRRGRGGGAHGGRTCSAPADRRPAGGSSRQRVGPVVGDLGRRDLDERRARGGPQRRAAPAARPARRRRAYSIDVAASRPPRRPPARARAARRARSRRPRARDAQREPDHTRRACA